MKTRNYFLGLAAISLFAVSCSGGGESHTEETSHAEEAHAEAPVNWVVDTESSNIRWEGHTAGAQVYGHFGDLAVKEGKLTTTGEHVSAGSFVVDMTSIEPKDENYSEEHPAADLVGHLTTDDFFLISEFPTAFFTVKSVEGNKVVGDLTIKGKTNEETVELENVEFSQDGSMMTAKGKLTFDRQKYGVAWAHFMKDVVLSDDINLEITLSAKKG